MAPRVYPRDFATLYATTIVTELMQFEQLTMDEPLTKGASQYDLVARNGRGVEDAQPTGTILMPVIGMAIGSGGSGQVIQVVVKGVISNSAWAWTSGNSIYPAAAGAVAEIPLTASGNIIQRIGRALTETSIYMDPDPTYWQIGQPD